MARGLCRRRPAEHHGALDRSDPQPRRCNMKWQTPAAQDFRFGFEITMYIAAR